MTSGGHTMTEGWNLQLQGRVRELEADLAEALRYIDTSAPMARAFIERMKEKRERAVAQTKDIDAFLEQDQ